MCHLQQLHEQYKDKGLVILGANCADDKQIALDMLRENKATFPNVLDSSNAATKVLYRDYRGSGVPLSYIIDREGNIVDAWYGGREQHERAEALLKRLGIE
jgi:peroxiredoxin